MRQNPGKRGKRETLARRERGWRQIEKITGPGLYDLPEFFRNGLYRLSRGGLPNAEIVRAYERCGAWLAKAKNGVGKCECGCETRRRVDSVNAQRNSIWHLDHDKHRKTFRGILFERCNRELGDGNRERKWAHVNYVEAHEARLPEETALIRDGNEFGAAGAVLD
jgi:hypothetical protein